MGVSNEQWACQWNSLKLFLQCFFFYFSSSRFFVVGVSFLLYLCCTFFASSVTEELEWSFFIASVSFVCLTCRIYVVAADIVKTNQPQTKCLQSYTHERRIAATTQREKMFRNTIKWDKCAVSRFFAVFLSISLSFSFFPSQFVYSPLVLKLGICTRIDFVMRWRWFVHILTKAPNNHCH